MERTSRLFCYFHNSFLKPFLFPFVYSSLVTKPCLLNPGLRYWGYRWFRSLVKIVQ